VYLREMGSVPLLTREGEVSLARKMERGKLRMQKAISRSPLIQTVVCDFAELIRREAEDLDSYVDLGPSDIEEGSAADLKRRNEITELFMVYLGAHKKLTQTYDKFAAVPTANKKLRKKWPAKWRGQRLSYPVRFVRSRSTLRVGKSLCAPSRRLRTKCPSSM
jgi:RNA polymerase primary sigma factor